MMTYLQLPLSQSPPPPVLPTITIPPSSTHLLAQVTTVQKIAIPLEKPLKYWTRFNHEEVLVQAMKELGKEMEACKILLEAEAGAAGSEVQCARSVLNKWIRHRGQLIKSIGQDKSEGLPMRKKGLTGAKKAQLAAARAAHCPKTKDSAKKLCSDIQHVSLKVLEKRQELLVLMTKGDPRVLMKMARTSEGWWKWLMTVDRNGSKPRLDGFLGLLPAVFVEGAQSA
ncbi:hypothetical protein B0H34DRAFT_808137 [Crassisporium funariophilum]|nr:hypothetical protein B0H34DRAFT_808137 [Crassisporium funariophilum]